MTPVMQESLLQAEILIDKAPMIQKEQAEKNITFLWPAAQRFLTHCLNYLSY